MERQRGNGKAGMGKRNDQPTASRQPASQPTASQPQRGAVGAVLVLVAGRGEERGVPAWWPHPNINYYGKGKE